MNEQLLQEGFIEFLKQKHGYETWVTVYQFEEKQNPYMRTSLYSGLISKNRLKESISKVQWDMLMSSRYPDFANRLVILREFHGMKTDYVEVCEDFRLFHNVYFDSKNSHYLTLDEAGNEAEAIRISDTSVQIRLNLLQSYIVAKRKVLLLFFQRTSKDKEILLDENECNEYYSEIKEPFFILKRYLGCNDLIEPSTFSVVRGKKAILGSKKSWCKKVFESFIIGQDKYGDLITHSSDPSKLSDFNGKDSDAPHYLTPVYFRKEVLTKYYNQPSKYSVEDSKVKCGEGGAGWICRIDNNLSDTVMVFLGDLGRDLPIPEQAYWKSFNIIPSDKGISEVNFNRSFLGEFTDPSEEDLKFKMVLNKFYLNWNKKFGWDLFKPLPENDKSSLSTLRIPLTDDQTEFDSQILNLAKLLIDGLNGEKLENALGRKKEKNEGTLSLLREYCKLHNFPQENVEFLKYLYRIRSSGAAHRRNSSYQKSLEELGVQNKSYPEAMRLIFRRSIQLLESLTAHFVDKP